MVEKTKIEIGFPIYLLVVCLSHVQCTWVVGCHACISEPYAIVVLHRVGFLILVIQSGYNEGLSLELLVHEHLLFLHRLGLGTGEIEMEWLQKFWSRGNSCIFWYLFLAYHKKGHVCMFFL